MLLVLDCAVRFTKIDIHTRTFFAVHLTTACDSYKIVLAIFTGDRLKFTLLQAKDNAMSVYLPLPYHCYYKTHFTSPATQTGSLLPKVD